MKFRYVVTDVDGVILDRMQMFADIFAQLCDEAWGAGIERARGYYLWTAGTPLPDQFTGVVRLCMRATSHKEMANLEKRFFAEVKRRNVDVFEGAVGTVQELCKEGRQLFATTGSQTDEIKRVFTAIEIRGYYVKIMGSDKIAKGEEHIHLFAEAVGVSFNEFCRHAVYVGDGAFDMETARRCKMLAVGLTTTLSEERMVEAGAQHILPSIVDLPELLARLEEE